MNPARQENMPTGNIFFLPSKHWFPSGWITSMMTTGSDKTHTGQRSCICIQKYIEFNKIHNIIIIFKSQLNIKCINTILCLWKDSFWRSMKRILLYFRAPTIIFSVNQIMVRPVNVLPESLHPCPVKQTFQTPKKEETPVQYIFSYFALKNC